MDEVADADRIILLQRGHILADDTPPALLARTGAPSLAAAYVTLTGERATSA